MRRDLEPCFGLWLAKGLVAIWAVAFVAVLVVGVLAGIVKLFSEVGSKRPVLVTSLISASVLVAIATALLLHGCGGDDPKLDCSKVNLSGSWKLHGEKIGGDDCSPDTLDAVESKSDETKYCMVRENKSYNECSESFEKVCPLHTRTGALLYPGVSGLRRGRRSGRRFPDSHGSAQARIRDEDDRGVGKHHQVV